MTTVWGIHNDELGVELFEQGFVSIGFAGVGDMRQVGNDREKMRLAVQRANPYAKAGAIPVWAGGGSAIRVRNEGGRLRHRAVQA